MSAGTLARLHTCFFLVFCKTDEFVIPLGSHWLTSPGPSPLCVAFLQWVGSRSGQQGECWSHPWGCGAHGREKICWNRFLRGEESSIKCWFPAVSGPLWGFVVWAPSCPLEGIMVKGREGAGMHAPSHLYCPGLLAPCTEMLPCSLVPQCRSTPSLPEIHHWIISSRLSGTPAL